MRKVVHNVIGVVALVAVVYIVSNYTGVIQEKVGVKGASTSRAQDISSNISSDLGTQFGAVEKKALDINVGDIIHGLSRFQKIPNDITSAKVYLLDQYNHISSSSAAKEGIIQK